MKYLKETQETLYEWFEKNHNAYENMKIIIHEDKSFRKHLS